MSITSTTIETILAHRSIRKFSPRAVDEALFTRLIACASMASTSNFLQCVSIIRVTDIKIRTKLMEYSSNQQYVLEAPEFLVFCIDFNKHSEVVSDAQLDWAEILLIGAVDTGIMAQNMLVAAESLGLGGVYIGSLRNNLREVSDLLKLPIHCAPIVGLCLGYPDQDPPIKPRFPNTMLCSENEYKPLNFNELKKYNHHVETYYMQRSGIEMNWSKNALNALQKPVRPHVLPYLQQQGFVKK